MTQMESIGELITEEDVDCLEHLQDITCTDKPDGKRRFAMNSPVDRSTVVLEEPYVPRGPSF